MVRTYPFDPLAPSNVPSGSVAVGGGETLAAAVATAKGAPTTTTFPRPPALGKRWKSDGSSGTATSR